MFYPSFIRINSDLILSANHIVSIQHVEKEMVIFYTSDGKKFEVPPGSDETSTALYERILKLLGF